MEPAQSNDQVHRQESIAEQGPEHGSPQLVQVNGRPPPPSPPPPPPTSPPPPPARKRVNSNPSFSNPILPHSRSHPPSAGPFRTGFNNSHTPLASSQSDRNKPAPHPRPSPLAFSFSNQDKRPPSAPTGLLEDIPHADPSTNSQALPNGLHQPTSSRGNQHHGRRHSRIHSRNLSVFFPRPGSLPNPSIAEDGTQELELSEDAPVSTMSNGPPSGALRPGFTFGERPSSAAGTPSDISMSKSRRRGHHHKHSLSHNIFSFLEPGADLPTPSPSATEELHTQPTPSLVSPWSSIFPIPRSSAQESTRTSPASPNPPALRPRKEQARARARIALGAAVTQFVLGAWLWVLAQQVGSLACTGLGYWIVFDAFGVALGTVVPDFLSREKMQDRIRRPYGNARVETLLVFAQSIYLIFSSVYVCKETVEHFLLSVGEGHHHHRGDEEADRFGISFPIRLTFITLLSTVGTAFFFKNHAKLVSITGNRIPPLRTLFRSLISGHPILSSSSRHELKMSAMSPFAALISNPYVAAPLLFAFAILFIVAFVPQSQHRQFDLLVAAIETVITFKLSYSASIVLGTVLLQTSPQRGLSGGRMEAFLRVMKEIERHPQVLHLPAPHIWQLTPSYLSPMPSYGGAQLVFPSPSSPSPSSLVATLELHVRKDLPDGEVLRLTRWAWERCVKALKGRTRDGVEGVVEVTVGIVRG